MSNNIKGQSNPLKNLKHDIPSGIVVFLVALPLCLGIALASGANLFAGLISGIVGGVVIGMLSGSNLAVSGPAAGLAVIVLDAIVGLGDYRIFLTAVVLAGALQILMGYAKAGIIANFFPSSVIKGMLAGIGVILILKQIPHLLGDDLDYFGDMMFLQSDSENTFSEIFVALGGISPGALIISLVSLAILLVWPKTPLAKINVLPSQLFVVIFGVILNQVFLAFYPSFALTGNHLVQIPVAGSFEGFIGNFTTPDWSGVLSYDVIIIAFTIAIIASLETLLSIEAIDKLDPMKRVTPTNRELKAQGVGNMVSGLIGGLPITAVIVRGSTNVAAGAKTKASAVIHGVLLFVCVVAIPHVLNMIPLSALAAILILVGYKLTNSKLIKEMVRKGQEQAVPFFATIAAIVFTDLLKGIAVGLIVAIYYILRRNFKNPFISTTEHENGKRVVRLHLSSEVSFLNKSVVTNTLEKIPENSVLFIDASKTHYIDNDVLEIIEDYKVQAEYKNIEVHLKNVKDNYKAVPQSSTKLEEVE